jgi:cytochrome c biogenesis factor
MHPALLHTHNLLRWAVLLFGVLALVRAWRGMAGDRDYAPARRAGVLFMATLHLQLLLGLGLFLVSPFIRMAMTDMRTTMGDAPTRFFVAEHPTLMIAAVVLMTIGGIVAKNANDAAKHRKLLIFTGVTLGLLLAGIPWQRPLFPGLG